MKKKKFRNLLSDIELECMIAVLLLKDNSHGIPIVEKVNEKYDKYSEPAVYANLLRMRRKGLFRITLVHNDSAKGGRPRKVYTVTSEGKKQYKRKKKYLKKLLAKTKSVK